jgi:hypothetical protein
MSASAAGRGGRHSGEREPTRSCSWRLGGRTGRAPRPLRNKTCSEWYPAGDPAQRDESTRPRGAKLTRLERALPVS